MPCNIVHQIFHVGGFLVIGWWGIPWGIATVVKKSQQQWILIRIPATPTTHTPATLATHTPAIPATRTPAPVTPAPHRPLQHSTPLCPLKREPTYLPMQPNRVRNLALLKTNTESTFQGENSFLKSFFPRVYHHCQFEGWHFQLDRVFWSGLIPPYVWGLTVHKIGWVALGYVSCSPASALRRGTQKAENPVSRIYSILTKNACLACPIIGQKG